MAAFKARLAANFLFFIYIFLFVFLIDWICGGSFIALLGKLFAGESFLERRLIPAVILTTVFFLLPQIARYFGKSKWEKEYDNYVSGGRVLSKNEKKLIRIFLIFTFTLPVLICGFLWLRLLTTAE